jgi:hypothetical protein
MLDTWACRFCRIHVNPDPKSYLLKTEGHLDSVRSHEKMHPSFRVMGALCSGPIDQANNPYWLTFPETPKPQERVRNPFEILERRRQKGLTLDTDMEMVITNPYQCFTHEFHKPRWILVHRRGKETSVARTKNLFRHLSKLVAQYCHQPRATFKVTSAYIGLFWPPAADTEVHSWRQAEALSCPVR